MVFERFYGMNFRATETLLIRPSTRQEIVVKRYGKSPSKVNYIIIDNVKEAKEYGIFSELQEQIMIEKSELVNLTVIVREN